MRKNLLLGAGNSRRKRVAWKNDPEWRGELVTLDMNPNCGADVVHDLEQRPLPFPDETFDELAAYDVLEHIGWQGDWKGFFDEFAEYWRLLKPGGIFGIIVPQAEDMLADPGHTRFFHSNHFGFLRQAWYEENLKENRPVTDYRWYWRHNFEIAFMKDDGHHLSVILEKA